MKKIIEAIKKNREDLISKYSAITGELETAKEGMRQARKLNSDEVYYKCWVKMTDLTSMRANLSVAINDLGNALNHLGEKTETFWG